MTTFCLGPAGECSRIVEAEKYWRMRFSGKCQAELVGARNFACELCPIFQNEITTGDQFVSLIRQAQKQFRPK